MYEVNGGVRDEGKKVESEQVQAEQSIGVWGS
jgi:hypothetical protein